MNATICEIVAAHIRQRTGRIVEAEPSDHLFDDLGLDSLDRVEICFEVEERFRIREIREGAILTVQNLIDAAVKLGARETSDA